MSEISDDESPIELEIKKETANQGLTDAVPLQRQLVMALWPMMPLERPFVAVVNRGAAAGLLG